ncbi:DUF502 domain-containing protein [Candidatus Omnitrophota bacterium]
MTKEHDSTLAKLRNNLFAGIAVLLPAVGTVLIVQFIVLKVNNVLLDPILELVTPAVQWADMQFIAGGVKVLILITILLLIAFLGFVVKNFFIRQILRFGEAIFLKIPFVNKIYTAIQQLSGTFLTKQKDMYNKVVLIEYPRKGVYIIGLMTSSCRGIIADKLPPECVNVFVPTTPNPTSGFLIMLPRDEVRELDVSVEEAMKVIVSGGIITPSEIRQKANSNT